MYKKILALTLIASLSNSISAEAARSAQRFQSCNPEQIALDSLAAEDEQLRHLTTEAPFFTAPMKGIVIAAAGVGLMAMRSNVEDKGMQNCLFHMGNVVFWGGAGYTVFSSWENGLQREILRNSLIARNKKN
jgi:hypothetical protein